jgi:hypothetical protein
MALAISILIVIALFIWAIGEIQDDWPDGMS